MGDSKWRRTSKKIILILFSVSILLMALSTLIPDNIDANFLVEESDLKVGKTVFEGDSIFDLNMNFRFPLIKYGGFIVNQIKDLDLAGILISVSTGSVPLDVTKISSGNISRSGIAYGFEGPGYLSFENNKLSVKGPDNFVWGKSIPYKVLTKTSEGANLIEDGKVIASLSAEDIKTYDYGNEFLNTTHAANWYNYAKEGSNFTVAKGIGDFSDNRSTINHEQLKEYFGDDVANYTELYPDYSPIMVYMNNYTENESDQFYTSLGSFAQYNNNIRAYNAIQFVEGWNNTIIPPGTSAHGKAYIDFGSASDPEAPGGSASHGVCPPARTLRNALISEGLPMPKGMTGGRDAVLFGFNPCEGISAYNNLDYPIKIVMWYTGSGTGLSLHTKIIRYSA